MPNDDHADRGDAQLAHYAKHRPNLFARFLAQLAPQDREQIQERTGNGLRWLGRRDKAQADDATGGDDA